MLRERAEATGTAMDRKGSHNLDEPSVTEQAAQSDASSADSARLENLAQSLTAERLIVLPFYHDLRNSIVHPERVKLQTDYFWRAWAPLLGPVRAMIVMKMRQYGYYNRQTRELRDEYSRTYDEIARSIGISTRTLERYFESESDPLGGPFRVLKDPLLAAFIKLRHQYVWRPGKSAPERTTNEYKIAMDEPLVPEDELILRLEAAKRLAGSADDETARPRKTTAMAGEQDLNKMAAPVDDNGDRDEDHTRQNGAYGADGERPSGNKAEKSAPSRHSLHTRQIDAYERRIDLDRAQNDAGERQSGGADSPRNLATQPVALQRTKQTTTTTTKNDAALEAASRAENAIDEKAAPRQVVATFEAANARLTTPLERRLLESLAAEFEDSANLRGKSGAVWLEEAIIEAVSSGSRYVAPKRLREILRRWATLFESSSEPEIEPTAMKPRVRATPRPPLAGRKAPRLRLAPSPSLADEGDKKNKFDSEGSFIGPNQSLEADERSEYESAVDNPPAPAPSFIVSPELGLTNKGLWAAVLEDLRENASPSVYSTWLKPTQLIARQGRTLVVGVPNSFARDWLAERYRAPLVRAVESVIGETLDIRFDVHA